MSERLSPRPGEWIDRQRVVHFRFEGKAYEGFAGDTISSALWCAGQRTLGRSFKYHRPRGITSFANHDVNVMVEDGRRTNLRGDITPITEGLDLTAVNTVGGVKGDKLRITEKFAKMMPVGFYYKAFHKPGFIFGMAERNMRKVAGLGHINAGNPAKATPKQYDYCDLAIIGAGPAGLSAALTAGAQGVNVLVIDEQSRPGGSALWQLGSSDEDRKTLQNLLAQVRAQPNVRILSGTEAAGWYTDHWIPLIDGTKLTKLRARATLVAAGAAEQPSVFHGNDVPGVMLASAAQRLMHLYAVKPCRRAVVVTANTDGYRAALDLQLAGVDVAMVADLRKDGENTELSKRVADMGIPIHRGHCAYEAVPSEDKLRLSAVVLARLNEKNEPDPSSTVRVQCDGLLVSVGWAPSAALLYQAGVKMKYDAALEQFVPNKLPDGVFAAGRVNGAYTLADRVRDGQRAGLAAAKYLNKYLGDVPDAVRHQGSAPSHPYPIFTHPKGKNFVDLDEDVHLADITNAHQEGYDSIELLKRYSTVGMGASQGKLANMASVRILARLNNTTIDKTGSTTSRPFYHPVSMEKLAGRRFHPHRLTPMHHLHEQLGAKFVHVGAWMRPEYYQNSGKNRDDLILEEATNVRKGIGIIDVGTLGKIEVTGPDAVTFLERIYTGKFAKQKVGTIRYALALDESGVIIDDGLVVRLAEERFYVTATTSAADAVYREMQRWLIIWGMQVTLVNATGRLTGLNIVGPKAREVLQPHCDLDLSPAAFPYVAAREGLICGVPARFMRVGFVGEVGYEIHFPATAGPHVWNTLMAAGKPHGIRPFGVEAQRLLRLEKGHIIVSQDTDAVTTPYEAAVEFALGMDKPFFVGQRSLRIIQRQELTRKLVGIVFPKDYAGPLPEECNLIIDGKEMTGRVTSLAKRSTLGYPLGLAFVKPNRTAPGTTVQIRLDNGQLVPAQVVKTPFYDPENAVQKT